VGQIKDTIKSSGFATYELMHVYRKNVCDITHANVKRTAKRFQSYINNILMIDGLDKNDISDIYIDMRIITLIK